MRKFSHGWKPNGDILACGPYDMVLKYRRSFYLGNMVLSTARARWVEGMES